MTSGLMCVLLHGPFGRCSLPKSTDPARRAIWDFGASEQAIQDKTTTNGLVAQLCLIGFYKWALKKHRILYGGPQKTYPQNQGPWRACKGY